MNQNDPESQRLLERLADLWPYLTPLQSRLVRLDVQFACIVMAICNAPILFKIGALTSCLVLLVLPALPSPRDLPGRALPLIWLGCYCLALMIVSVLPRKRRMA